MWQLQQHVQLHLGLRSEANQPPLVLLQGFAVSVVELCIYLPSCGSMHHLHLFSGGAMQVDSSCILCHLDLRNPRTKPPDRNDAHPYDLRLFQMDLGSPRTITRPSYQWCQDQMLDNSIRSHHI
jgi:hypothetical protein